MKIETVMQALDYLQSTDAKHAKLNAQHSYQKALLNMRESDYEYFVDDDYASHCNDLALLQELDAELTEIENRRETARLIIQSGLVMGSKG